MRAITLLVVGLVAMLSTLAILSGDEQAGSEAPKPEISIGEMRVQTVPAMSYLCTPAETSFAKMSDPVRVGFERVFLAVTDAKLLVARPTMLVYQGNPHFGRQETFKMEIGVIVADDATINGDDGLTIRKTKPFKCATILYTGTVDRQGQAYEKLIPLMAAAGLKPNGEEREMCIYWEGMDSSNNIFMMMIGIE